MGCVNQAVVFMLLLSVSGLLSSSKAQNFKCSSKGICKALVGYVPVNDTSYSNILHLFNVKNLRSVLGANNLSLTTNRSSIVKAKKPVKIPISCLCTNGTGVSHKGPVYTVKKGDGLYFIAATVFSGLLLYQKIVEVNNIANENVIEVGQNLTIPLPCSCDDVDGDKVVHYAHVVQAGSSLQSIAQQFGTNVDTLKKLNDIDDSKLKAETSIDVPLKACNSSFATGALDSGLLAANGTYVFTAKSCVKCSCDSSRSLTLQCERSELNSTSSKEGACSLSQMQCMVGSAQLLIGSSTSDSCNRTTCTYAGYNRTAILRTLNSESTCPTQSISSTISSSRSFLFISIHLVLLCLHMFQ